MLSYYPTICNLSYKIRFSRVTFTFCPQIIEILISTIQRGGEIRIYQITNVDDLQKFASYMICRISRCKSISIISKLMITGVIHKANMPYEWIITYNTLIFFLVENFVFINGQIFFFFFFGFSNAKYRL